MTVQALNYTPKAIDALMSHPCPAGPETRSGMRYLAQKLQQAEVFVLTDGGQLLDRSKPRPEVPALVFKPPFPVVAIEYEAAGEGWGDTVWTAAKCSKRISLAWEQDVGSMPYGGPMRRRFDRPGVVIASICYYDAQQTWMPVFGGLFMPFDANYIEQVHTPFRADMVETGRLKSPLLNARALRCEPVPLLPEVVVMTAAQHGADVALDLLRADMMDEANAYLDLCVALSCKNVTSSRCVAEPRLNKARVKAGRAPLKDFHVLELRDGDHLASAGGHNSGSRPHLRRGHIRRIAGNRVTWVNAAMVRGRGQFLNKQYGVSRAGASS